jgi:hypothetical protein
LEILRAIKGIPRRRLAQASGLSVSHCALIRRGERVPHLRKESSGGELEETLDHRVDLLWHLELVEVTGPNGDSDLQVGLDLAQP